MSRRIHLSGSYISTLHLYRHLLREVSYLPPSCQPYFRAHIRSSFRRHPTRPSPPSSLPSPAPISRRLARARHALRYLHGANMGYVANMHRLLLMAYGRIGPRRRALVSAFVQRSLPANSEALAKELGNRAPETNQDWLESWDLPKLHALASSQASRSFYSFKPEIKGGNRLQPERTIPKTNVWGRPLAKKLVRSKLRRWYKKLADRIMPPLGRGQWEALGALATGKADRSLWEMPARRTRVGGNNTEEQGKDGGDRWDWRKYAVEAARSVDRGKSRSRKGLTGEVDTGPYGSGEAIGIHNYSIKRVWQRLYMRVWESTPTMAQRPGHEGQWLIEWGGPTQMIPVARPGQMAFFEGTSSDVWFNKSKKSKKEQK